MLRRGLAALLTAALVAVAKVQADQIVTNATCMWSVATNSCGLSLSDLSVIYPDEAAQFGKAENLYVEMAQRCPNLPVAAGLKCPSGCSVRVSLSATQDICVPPGTTVNTGNAQAYLKAWTDDLCGEYPQTSVCIQGRVQEYKYFGCASGCDKTLGALQTVADKCSAFKSQSDCTNVLVSGSGTLYTHTLAAACTVLAALWMLL